MALTRLSAQVPCRFPQAGLEIKALLFDYQRPLLHQRVDGPDVLADYPKIICSDMKKKTPITNGATPAEKRFQYSSL